MTRSTPLLLVSILLLAACGPAPYTCTDPLGCLEIAPEEPIVIGVLAALSGPGAPAGTEMLAAVQAAVEEADVILSHEVELVWEGTDCTADSARYAATLLAQNPDLLAVIGPSCPADAPFAVPILEDAGIAVITPRSGDAAYQQLVAAIKTAAILKDGALILPRAAFQEALEGQP